MARSSYWACAASTSAKEYNSHASAASKYTVCSARKRDVMPEIVPGLGGEVRVAVDDGASVVTLVPTAAVVKDEGR
jgi:hypothetical protein